MSLTIALGIVVVFFAITTFTAWKGWFCPICWLTGHGRSDHG